MNAIVSPESCVCGPDGSGWRNCEGCLTTKSLALKVWLEGERRKRDRSPEAALALAWAELVQLAADSRLRYETDGPIEARLAVLRAASLVTGIEALIETCEAAAGGRQEE